MRSQNCIDHISCNTINEMKYKYHRMTSEMPTDQRSTHMRIQINAILLNERLGKMTRSTKLHHPGLIRFVWIWPYTIWWTRSHLSSNLYPLHRSTRTQLTTKPKCTKNQMNRSRTIFLYTSRDFTFVNSKRAARLSLSILRNVVKITFSIKLKLML